jgi:DNA-binding NarL/FixJ family response regulator
MMDSRVIVADGSDLMRAALVSALDGTFKIAATCGTLDDLLVAVRRHAPAAIVFEDRLELESTVLALVEQVCTAAPASCKLVLIGGFYNGYYVADLLSAGIHAYVFRGDPLQYSLSEAVRFALAGKHYLSPTANADYLAVRRSSRRPALVGPELQVLRLLGEGYEVQRIALKLEVPCRRVYKIRQRLRDRLGADTNEGIIVRARQHGYLH